MRRRNYDIKLMAIINLLEQHSLLNIQFVIVFFMNKIGGFILSVIKKYFLRFFRGKFNSYIRHLPMLLISLLLIPVVGIFGITITSSKENSSISTEYSKNIALVSSISNLFVSLIVFVLFNFSSNQFQFVQEYYKVNNFDFYLGVDGISIYFVLLTTIIMPISLLAN